MNYNLIEYGLIGKVKKYKAIVKKLFAKQKLNAKENEFLKKEKVI